MFLPKIKKILQITHSVYVTYMFVCSGLLGIEYPIDLLFLVIDSFPPLSILYLSVTLCVGWRFLRSSTMEG